jgi:hypothetical protein
LSIWSYSLTYAVRSRSYRLEENDIRTLYRRWREETFWPGSRQAFSLPRLSWAALAGPGWQEERQLRGPRSSLVPDESARDPVRLERYLAQRGEPVLSSSVWESDCGLKREAAELDLALAEMLKFSDKVLVYLAPSAPLDRSLAPACLLPAVQALLRSRAGPRVVVEVGDRDSYGLTQADYLHPLPGSGQWQYDPLHVNAAGARKVTGRVSRLAAQALLSPPGAGAGKTAQSEGGSHGIR